jgi:4-aminobutyrate aminotransferase-like enzyme
VHYSDPPKIFARCEGSYPLRRAGTPFLDLQMWYSAVNFGYANPRLNDALQAPDRHVAAGREPVPASDKIELAKIIALDAKAKWGRDGRVHFNVGGAQAVEDSLKLVRNASSGKSLMFAFEGGYHGRTLGASAITSSYRYRRATAISIARSSSNSRTTSAARRACRRRNTATTASQVRAPVRDRIQRRLGPKPGSANTPRSTSSRSRAPAAT